MITRKGLADEIDAIDASIKDLNASKSEAYQAYREQLEGTGMEARRAGAELAAVKAAIVKRRKLAQDPDAVAEKDDLIGTILAEIQARPSRARETGRDYQDRFLPQTPVSEPSQAPDTAGATPSAPATPVQTDRADPTVADGQPSTPSSEALARAKNDDVCSVVVGQSHGRGNSGQAVTHSDEDVPAFLIKDHKPLRPNCLNPADCAGYGRVTCHRCLTAAGQSEAAA